MSPEATYSRTDMAKLLNTNVKWVRIYLNPQFKPDADNRYSAVCWRDLKRRYRQWKRIPLLGNNFTLPAAELELGTSRIKIEKLIAELGLPGVRQYRRGPKKLVDGIPRSTVAKLRRHQFVGVLGRNSSVVQAANELICTREQVLELVRRHNLAGPFTYRTRFGVTEGVPRSTMVALRALIPPYAEPELISVPELSLLTGWAKDTVRLRLDRSPLQSYVRRNYNNGHTMPYYNREAALFVVPTKPSAIRPAGSMLTVSRIAVVVGRSRKWVRCTIQSKPILAAQGQVRRDDKNNLRLHYPDSIIIEVERLSDLSRRPTATRTNAS